MIEHPEPLRSALRRHQLRVRLSTARVRDVRHIPSWQAELAALEADGATEAEDCALIAQHANLE